MAINIEFVASPNRSLRRLPITAIVLHYSGSDTLEGTVDWFKKPTSGYSAHYVVGRTGKIVQMVKETDVAWHAGQSAMRPDLPEGDPRREKGVNAFSIGIELIGTADSGFTDRQLASCYYLIELLVNRYKIHPDRVVGHAHIAPGRRIDPDGYDRQFPWGKARQIAQVAWNVVKERDHGE